MTSGKYKNGLEPASGTDSGTAPSAGVTIQGREHDDPPTAAATPAHEDVAAAPAGSGFDNISLAGWRETSGESASSKERRLNLLFPQALRRRNEEQQLHYGLYYKGKQVADISVGVRISLIIDGVLKIDGETAELRDPSSFFSLSTTRQRFEKYDATIYAFDKASATFIYRDALRIKGSIHFDDGKVSLDQIALGRSGYSIAATLSQSPMIKLGTPTGEVALAWDVKLGPGVAQVWDDVSVPFQSFVHEVGEGVDAMMYSLYSGLKAMNNIPKSDLIP